MGFSPFRNTSPATGVVAVTTSDSTSYEPPLRALWIGVTGNVAVTCPDGTTATISNVPVGLLPVVCTKVMATNTTATTIVGFY